MFLSKNLSDRIVTVAYSCLGLPFDWQVFNCVHFVRKVYFDVGIDLPLLDREDLPPSEFHLLSNEFALMPIGHSVFFKRRECKLNRSWPHVAIIANSNQLIHCCAGYLGSGVILTSKAEFMEVYDLAPSKIVA